MQERYHLQTKDGTQFIEWERNAIGLQLLSGLRKCRPDLFKFQQIEEIIRKCPDQIRQGVLYRFD
jgi:hypothetical protein